MTADVEGSGLGNTMLHVCKRTPPVACHNSSTNVSWPYFRICCILEAQRKGKHFVGLPIHPSIHLTLAGEYSWWMGEKGICEEVWYSRIAVRQQRIAIYKPPRRARTRCNVAPPSRLYSEAVFSSDLGNGDVSRRPCFGWRGSGVKGANA